MNNLAEQQEYVSELVRAARSSFHTKSRENATRELGNFETTQPGLLSTVVSALNEIANDDTCVVREIAVYSLGKIAERCTDERMQKRVVGMLAQKARDKTWIVADAAVEVLTQLGLREAEGSSTRRSLPCKATGHGPKKQPARVLPLRPKRS